MAGYQAEARGQVRIHFVNRYVTGSYYHQGAYLPSEVFVLGGEDSHSTHKVLAGGGRCW